MMKWSTSNMIALAVLCWFASIQDSNASGIHHLADSLIPKATYSPRKAIIRSAIIPGWGQVTNRKIWKVPLVYGALGSAVYLFNRNLNQYREARTAYLLATDNIPENDAQIPQPYYSVRTQPERIRVFRNQVRQNLDYSILFFIACWGLNVVDAAVDAHLKTYDINESLSLSIHAGRSSISGQHGIGLQLNIK
jgi:hypothetical protein